MKDRSQFTPLLSHADIDRGLTFGSCHRANLDDWTGLCHHERYTNVVYRAGLFSQKTEELLFREESRCFPVQCFPEQNGSDNCVKASFQISITVGSSLRLENHRGIMYLLSSITGSTGSPSRSSRRLLSRSLSPRELALPPPQQLLIFADNY